MLLRLRWLPEVSALQAAESAGSSWSQTCDHAATVVNLATQGPCATKPEKSLGPWLHVMRVQASNDGTSPSRSEKEASSPVEAFSSSTEHTALISCTVDRRIIPSPSCIKKSIFCGKRWS